MGSAPPQKARRARAFWPGFRWRVLAHQRSAPHSRGKYLAGSFDARSGIDFHARERAEDRQVRLDGHWEFDELVIDDWFHLEQMNDRDWWLGVGNGDDFWHVNIHVDRDGKASVQMEKQ